MLKITRELFEENDKLAQAAIVDDVKGLKDQLNLLERILKLKSSSFNDKGNVTIHTISFGSLLPMQENHRKEEYEEYLKDRNIQVEQYRIMDKYYRSCIDDGDISFLVEDTDPKAKLTLNYYPGSGIYCIVYHHPDMVRKEKEEEEVSIREESKSPLLDRWRKFWGSKK